MVGCAMARRIRSGTLVGPGIWRKCRPLFTASVNHKSHHEDTTGYQRRADRSVTPDECRMKHMSVIVGRSRIATRYGIVAASQPLAAQAGVQILERGGNAIDAAIATNAV